MCVTPQHCLQVPGMSTRHCHKTEMRPRRSKNVSRPQSRSLKTLTGEVCHLTNMFLAGQTIHYFLPDISASLMHCTDDHKTQSHETRDPRPRRYIFKTETRPICSKKRIETASRPRRSRPRLHHWVTRRSSRSGLNNRSFVIAYTYSELFTNITSNYMFSLKNIWPNQHFKCENIMAANRSMAMGHNGPYATRNTFSD